MRFSLFPLFVSDSNRDEDQNNGSRTAKFWADQGLSTLAN